MAKASFSQSIGSKSITNIIIDRITDGIISGELKPGSKIPTELELCEMWHVGRNSVREAVKALVHIGILEIRRSEGTFVMSEFSEKMLHPLLYSLMLENNFSDSLIELRQIFEVGVFQLAIKKANDDDIAIISKANDHLKSLLSADPLDAGAILEADIEFHRTIESSTHNPLINRINSVITELTLPSRKKTSSRLLAERKTQSIIDAHQSMFDVIKTHDESHIINTVNNHNFYWSKTFQDTLKKDS